MKHQLQELGIEGGRAAQMCGTNDLGLFHGFPPEAGSRANKKRDLREVVYLGVVGVPCVLG